MSLLCPDLPPLTPLWRLIAPLCWSNLQEFENAEGDEYVADFSEQGSPAAPAQNGPDVYVLPLTEVSLPMAKQPGRSGKWTCLPPPLCLVVHRL